jgi:D-alanyl-D-alanine carboxypeptidase/D-alanyl-D-alanine-endopeptidase (penicillin-binding protein 4)
LYAEQLLFLCGRAKYGKGGLENGTKAIEDYLENAGCDIHQIFMQDGSGLSRYNSISAKLMTDYLIYLKKNGKYFNDFYNTLPVAGSKGTLRNYFKGTVAENNIHAKSGYMSRVRSYAGYVKTKSDREVAFCFIVNNYSFSDGDMRTKMHEIMLKLAELDI